MKIIAKDLKGTVYPTGGAQLSFDCSLKAKQAVESLIQGEYVLTIERVRNSRTLNQNALLWALIGEICETENGNRNTEDEEQIYKNILLRAGMACTYIQCIPDAIKELRGFYRIVEPVERRNNSVVVKCYKGVSQMDTAQASRVIESALQYAELVGIDPDPIRKEIENGRNTE